MALFILIWASLQLFQCEILALFFHFKLFASLRKSFGEHHIVTLLQIHFLRGLKTNAFVSRAHEPLLKSQGWAGSSASECLPGSIPAITEEEKLKRISQSVYKF